MPQPASRRSSIMGTLMQPLPMDGPPARTASRNSHSAHRNGAQRTSSSRSLLQPLQMDGPSSRTGSRSSATPRRTVTQPARSPSANRSTTQRTSAAPPPRTTTQPTTSPTANRSTTQRTSAAPPPRPVSQPQRAAPANTAPKSTTSSAPRSLPPITVQSPQSPSQPARATRTTSSTVSPTSVRPNSSRQSAPSNASRSAAPPVSAASRRSSTVSSPGLSLRRENSFQVVSPAAGGQGASRDTTPLPEDFYVMYCHRCFRFSCARLRVGETTVGLACPTCRHTPVEVPRTRSGLFAMYRRAAVKHNADPDSTVALQAMISLHHQTHAPVVLFRGLTDPTTGTAPSPPAGSNARPAPRRPFVEDTFTADEIMFTFEQFPRGLGTWNGGAAGSTTCVVCLEDCSGCGKPVVKLQGCGHYFHAACVKPWVLEKHYTCPMCRAPMIVREPL